jgi:hypothetical protein
MTAQIEMFGVTVAEPTTVLTDYLIAVAAGWFAAKLMLATRHRQHSCRILWGLGFLCVGIGALLGGTSHGFASYLSETAGQFAWKSTLCTVGLSMFFAVAGTLRGTALSSRLHRVLGAINVAGLLAYGAWILGHNTYLAAIIVTVAALSLVALLQGYAWRNERTGSATWLIAGVLVSFISAGVLRSGYAPHEHLNQNDLYHIVQLFGLYLLYRGATLLTDKQSGNYAQNS